MAQPARYLFDLDFSAPPEPEIEEVVEEIIEEEEPPEPTITVAEHEQLIETIRQQAYEQGLEEGRQEREQSATEKNIELQKTILDEIAMIYTEVGVLMARLEKDASTLAFRFASRFAQKLVDQEPKAEIQALLNQILAPLRKSPHLTIRVHSDLAQDIKASTKKQMKELGFKGNLMVRGDDMIAPGDCEVEWNDGGIGRNMRDAIQHAETLLEQHFATVPEEEIPEAEDTEAEDTETEDEEQTDAETPMDQADDTAEPSGKHTEPSPSEQSDTQTTEPSQTSHLSPDSPDQQQQNNAAPHDDSQQLSQPNQAQGEPL